MNLPRPPENLLQEPIPPEGLPQELRQGELHLLLPGALELEQGEECSKNGGLITSNCGMAAKSRNCSDGVDGVVEAALLLGAAKAAEVAQQLLWSLPPMEFKAAEIAGLLLQSLPPEQFDAVIHTAKLDRSSRKDKKSRIDEAIVDQLHEKSEVIHSTCKSNTICPAHLPPIPSTENDTLAVMDSILQWSSYFYYVSESESVSVHVQRGRHRTRDTGHSM